MQSNTKKDIPSAIPILLSQLNFVIIVFYLPIKGCKLSNVTGEIYLTKVRSQIKHKPRAVAHLAVSIHNFLMLIENAFAGLLLIMRSSSSLLKPFDTNAGYNCLKIFV